MNTRKNMESSAGLFQVGVVLFLVGMMGLLIWFSRSRVFDLAHFWDQEVQLVMDFKGLDRLERDQRDQIFPWVSEQLKTQFGRFGDLGIEDWMGDKAGVAYFSDGEIIWAFQTRSRSKVQKKLTGLLGVSDEMNQTVLKKGTIWTPSFSSDMGFGFSGKWVFLATSEKRLREQFETSHPLSETAEYKNVFADIPRKGVFRLYLDTQSYFSHLVERPAFASKKPIIKALGETFQALGASGTWEKDQLTFHTKILTHEGVFHKEFLQKNAKDIIPQLASFVPQDGLWFMTGYDFYEKYKHTQTFLSQLHDQFALIFQGLLRSQSQELFGKDFDFDQDFLSHMHGQYALWIDQEGMDWDGLQYVFMTGFGGSDKEQSLEHLLEALRYAQSRFMTEVQTVELPDGTFRQELVSLDPENVPIRKVETDFGPYYTFKNEKEEVSFSFGFFDGYLIFSTDQSAIEKVLASLEGRGSRLSENEDFRESVLFRYAPSESYGFINASKIDKLWAMLGENPDQPLFWNLLGLGRSHVRNISFARRVYPEEIYITFTAFGK